MVQLEIVSNTIDQTAVNSKFVTEWTGKIVSLKGGQVEPLSVYIYIYMHFHTCTEFWLAHECLRIFSSCHSQGSVQARYVGVPGNSALVKLLADPLRQAIRTETRVTEIKPTEDKRAWQLVSEKGSITACIVFHRVISRCLSVFSDCFLFCSCGFCCFLLVFF